MYAARLDKECRVKVREAKDGDLVEDGKILIAPGDKHMTLMRENGRYYVKCFEAEKSKRSLSVSGCFVQICCKSGGE